MSDPLLPTALLIRQLGRIEDLYLLSRSDRMIVRQAREALVPILNAEMAAELDKQKGQRG